MNISYFFFVVYYLQFNLIKSILELNKQYFYQDINYLSFNSNFNSNIWIENFILEINKSLLHSLGNDLTKDRDYEKCKKIILNKNITESVIWDLIKFSGHNFLDQGYEKECIENNYTFYLLIKQYTSTSNSSYNYNDNEFLISFLSYSSSFFGFCVHNECKNITQKYIESLKKFYSNSSKYSLKYYSKNKNEDFKLDYEDNSYQYKIFTFFFIFIIIFLIFRIIINCIGFFLLNFKENEIKIEQTDSSESSDDDSSNRSLDSFRKVKKRIIFSNNLSKVIKYDNNKKSCFFTFYKYFSFTYGFNYIFIPNNIYFNEKGIRLIYFLRVLSLFLICYNHNIWTIINLPTKELENILFFKSFSFVFIKYSTYGNHFFIILDGIIFAFKFMNYIKNNCIKRIDDIIYLDLSLAKLIKFYLKSLPNIISFFFIFFTFFYYLKYSFLLFDMSTMFKYLIEDIVSCRECITHLKSFFTLNFLYYDYYPFEKQVIGFQSCFKFTVIMVNEFICFSIILLIIYLSLKIKNIIFDYCILILLIINSLLSNLQCNMSIGKLYKFENIMQSNCSLKYTHLFPNIYLSGFFVGMAIFYYNDLTNKNSLEALGLYKPFNYCYSLIAFLDKRKNFTKKFLFFLCVFIQIISSLSFFLYVRFPNIFKIDLKENFLFEIKPIIVLIDKSLRFLAVLSFIFLIIFIYIYPKETFFAQIYNSNFYLPFSRVGFSFYCDLDIIIYIFYSLYRPDIHLSFLNISLITLGFIILIGLINLFIFLIIEMPLLIIMKSHNNNENELLNNI